MSGIGATAAVGGFSSSPQLEEEAAVSTSTYGDEAANTKRRRACRTIKAPGAAAVLATGALSYKTEPMEGGEGRGAVEATLRPYFVLVRLSSTW